MQICDVWEPSKNQYSFGNRGALDRKYCYIVFWGLKFSRQAKSPFLPHDDWVRLEIGHVDHLPLLLDFRMWCKHQPADVREQEPTASIMRVRVCLAVLMVNPVVQCPLIHVALWTEFRYYSPIHAGSACCHLHAALAVSPISVCYRVD